MRRRYLEMSDEELRDAIAEARRMSAGGTPACDRLADYAGEAAKRLVQRHEERRGRRIAYLKGLGARAFAVIWWLHLAAVMLLVAIAVEESGRRYGRPMAAAAGAVLLAGGMIVTRWVLAGRWAFGPKL